MSAYKKAARAAWNRTPARVRSTLRPAVKALYRHSQLLTIVASRTFDKEWYEAQRGRRFDSQRAAVADYLCQPRRSYLSPHPLFEPEWLDDRQWASRLTDPLVWFLRSNRTFRRSPHPLVDAWAANAVRDEGAPTAAAWRRLVRSLTPNKLLPLGPGYREVTWSELRSALVNEVAAWRRDQQLAGVPRSQLTWNRRVEVPASASIDRLWRQGSDGRPFVSVVVPTWNRASLLARSIGSVQAQTWSDFEIIVVDDGSTDDTYHVVRGICEFDTRVRLVTIERAGVSAARNRGIDEARGELVAFLDTDNTWEPDFLRSMVEAIEANEWDLAHAVLRVEDRNGGYFRAFEGTHDHLLIGNYIDLNVLVVRASLLREIGGFDTTLRRAIDYDLVLRLSRRADLHLVPVVGAVYAAESSDGHRISVSEPTSWNAVVRARHLIDWDEVASKRREPDRVSVALPFRARLDATVRWVDAVRELSLEGHDLELCMVSSGSARAHRLVAASLAHTLPRASFVSAPHNVAFATATNLAIAAATGATLVVARPNLVPLKGWLPPLLETLHRRGTAVVQCLVLSSDDLIASAGGVFARDSATPERLLEGFPISDALRIGEAFRVPAALSGVLAVRTIDAIACRGFDPLVGNSMTDVDFSLRLAEAARGITMVDTRSRMRGQAPGRFGFPHDWGLAARVLADRWASPPDGSRALWTAAGLEVDGYREVRLPSATGPPARVFAPSSGAVGR